MKGLKYLPEVLLCVFVLLLMWTTFITKIAFLNGQTVLNLVLLLPVLTFYGMFKMLQQLVKETMTQKVVTAGLSVGLMVFNALLLLAYIIR